MQVKSQIDLSSFDVVHWPETTLAAWLLDTLPNGGKVGFAPWLHTASEIEKTISAVTGSSIELIASANLIDRIWEDQPSPPLGQIKPHPLKFAGESSADKCARLATELKSTGCTTAVITRPDSIAWLLNVRGTDIERNPVPHAFGLLHDDATVSLFAEPEKTTGLQDHLGGDVTLLSPDKFEPTLKTLSGIVSVDRDSAPMMVTTLLKDAGIKILYQADPCLLPKACKNDVEIAGSVEAHLRDGAAMVEFLAWLNTEGPKGGLTEIDVVKNLEGFRRATNSLQDISFETISGAGPNGAIVHYSVTEETNRAVNVGELLLVDSGGQYLDGTTDITRTVAIGAPTAEQITCFTRVLQGMIAISRARFPIGVAGAHLDVLARAPLWMAGQDYDHGTGHGVGSFLSVHEGPQRLSRTGIVPLQSGMILSNEPGYYREGEFGIRIENLIVVQDAPKLAGADDRKMLDFKTLTFVPIDRTLINPDMLSTDERDWLNSYHAETREKLSGRVHGAALEWLIDATQPI